MKKLISIWLLVFSLLLANVVPAFAVNHYGDAVYRDGVLDNLTWHAAINNYSTVGSYVIEAFGKNGIVQRSSWATFTGSGAYNYQGPPQYRTGMTDSDLNNVVNTARLLADRANIPYSTIDLMQGSVVGNYIVPNNVSYLRCDGLVEYAYEWNGVNCYVSLDKNGNWDISHKDSRPYHSSLYPTWTGNTFNPVTQWSSMNPHYD